MKCFALDIVEFLHHYLWDHVDNASLKISAHEKVSLFFVSEIVTMSKLPLRIGYSNCFITKSCLVPWDQFPIMCVEMSLIAQHQSHKCFLQICCNYSVALKRKDIAETSGSPLWR